ncbi:DUF2971 domain-containing protein [Sphingobium tyrosinilyticum]|uniref:DUF2971 domain-containing protein n=1 Tax=Sphingobium tyrosinilyticum TaxID=2715436 RepID=A0ABV9EXV0_9SPHN
MNAAAAVQSQEDALAQVIFGYASDRQDRLDRENIKLAHYTTAETALQILTGRKLWMRNATVMNDHSEIQHGHEIVGAALAGEPGARLRDILAGISTELLDAGWPRLTPLSEDQKCRIFMCSLSEHQADDTLGRLSMWRAYGGSIAGVALIFNSEVIENPNLHLSTAASPVLYGGYAELAHEFDNLSSRLEQNASLLRSVDPLLAGTMLGSAIHYAYMSIKHIGFQEELEWRLIHCPLDSGGSAHVRDHVASIRGVPQLLYELPLANIHQGMNFPNFDLNSLLHRIIIGPSLYPGTVRRAFVEQLRELGVVEAEAKVVVSETPLRQWG